MKFTRWDAFVAGYALRIFLLHLEARFEPATYTKWFEDYKTDHIGWTIMWAAILAINLGFWLWDKDGKHARSE